MKMCRYPDFRSRSLRPCTGALRPSLAAKIGTPLLKVAGNRLTGPDGVTMAPARGQHRQPGMEQPGRKRAQVAGRGDRRLGL